MKSTTMPTSTSELFGDPAHLASIVWREPLPSRRPNAEIEITLTSNRRSASEAKAR